MIHPGDRERCKQILQRLLAGEDVGRLEIAFVTKNGAIIMVEGQTNCRMEDGQPVCTRAIFRDVTRNRQHLRQLELTRRELQKANAKLALAATTDGLTGVHNRSSFQRKLAEDVLRCTRYKTQLSILMIDVDHFKSFNDTFGHAAGDEALIGVANLPARHRPHDRLRGSLRRRRVRHSPAAHR